MHIILTARQLREALEFCNQDGPDDADQMDTEITLTEREAFVSSDGEQMPAGLYCHLTEYPEEGCYGPLGVAPAAPAPGTCPKCSKPWEQHEFAVPAPYCP